MAGEGARPGWIANVNPFVVVCFVGLITRFMAKFSAITSIIVGMFLIPLSALLMACGNMLGSDIVSGMSNITLMMIIGIVFQALAECFISPRYLEYFSLQAPKGEEGLYLGFSHLDSFLSSILGFGISGVLLSKYCPDPALFESRGNWNDCGVGTAPVCIHHTQARPQETICGLVVAAWRCKVVVAVAEAQCLIHNDMACRHWRYFGHLVRHQNDCRGRRDVGDNVVDLMLKLLIHIG